MSSIAAVTSLLLIEGVSARWASGASQSLLPQLKHVFPTGGEDSVSGCKVLSNNSAVEDRIDNLLSCIGKIQGYKTPNYTEVTKMYTVGKTAKENRRQCNASTFGLSEYILEPPIPVFNSNREFLRLPPLAFTPGNDLSPTLTDLLLNPSLLQQRRDLVLQKFGGLISCVDLDSFPNPIFGVQFLGDTTQERTVERISNIALSLSPTPRESIPAAAEFQSQESSGCIRYNESTGLLKTAIDALTYVSEAEVDFWTFIKRSTPFNTQLPLKRIDQRTPLYTEMYDLFGDEIFRESKRRCFNSNRNGRGSLYVVDLRFFETVPPLSMGPAKPRVIPGTVVLLCAAPREERVYATAVRLSKYKAPGSGAQTEYEVYSRGSSNSKAYILSLAMARSSVAAFGSAVGHVGMFHVHFGGALLSLLSNMEISHPLIKTIFPFLPQALQHSFIFLGGAQPILFPFSFPSDTQGLLNDLDRALEALDYNFNSPDILHILRENRIRRRDFTTEGGDHWNLFPAVKDLIEIRKATLKLAKRIVFNVYNSAKEVRCDVQLQTAFQDIQKNFIDGPIVLNRMKLSRNLGLLLYDVIGHSTAALACVSDPAQILVTGFASALPTTDLPDPKTSRDLTDKEFFNFLPTSFTLASNFAFINFFIFGSDILLGKALIPDPKDFSIDPIWDRDSLPDTLDLASRDAVIEAGQIFREEVAGIISSCHEREFDTDPDVQISVFPQTLDA